MIQSIPTRVEWNMTNSENTTARNAKVNEIEHRTRRHEVTVPAWNPTSRHTM